VSFILLAVVLYSSMLGVLPKVFKLDH